MTDRVEVPRVELEALIEAADNLQGAVGAAVFRVTTKGILTQAYEKYLFARGAWIKAAHLDGFRPGGIVPKGQRIVVENDEFRPFGYDGPQEG
jgi:hypothetical protein